MCNMLRQRSVKKDQYEPLNQTSSDDFHPSQFEKPKPKFPIKSAILIFTLFFIGIFCLISAISNYDSDPWPFLILAIITLLPGAFYGWICLAVLLKIGGYSVEDIP